MTEFHKGRMKTLLDAFFHEQDQKLLAALRERSEKMDRRERLTAVSGIRDEAVLDRLVELEIEPETLAAMSVVPLVHVAWADGKVQDEEREVIMAAAGDAGIAPDDGRYPLLECWLSRPPGAEMIEAWKHYVKGLCGELDEHGVEQIRKDVLAAAEKVAKAAGGFLGLGNKISAAELAVLDELERAFS